MSQINDLIKDKLSEYDEDVQSFIFKALELSCNSKETSVSEQLQGYVRQLIKK